MRRIVALAGRMDAIAPATLQVSLVDSVLVAPLVDFVVVKTAVALSLGVVVSIVTVTMQSSVRTAPNNEDSRAP